VPLDQLMMSINRDGIPILLRRSIICITVSQPHMKQSESSESTVWARCAASIAPWGRPEPLPAPEPAASSAWAAWCAVLVFLIGASALAVGTLQQITVHVIELERSSGYTPEP
jgi:hypothetical protein